MRIKELFNIKNIASFIEGNAKYFYDQLLPLPQHTKDQIIWRLSKCESDCLVEGVCRKCTCPPIKKAFVNESCNPERFPDLMNKEDWEQYKKDNNI